MVMDTSDAEVSDMSDEDGGGQPTRRARPNGIKRSVRCDLYGLLQRDSRDKGLGGRRRWLPPRSSGRRRGNEETRVAARRGPITRMRSGRAAEMTRSPTRTQRPEWPDILQKRREWPALRLT